RTTACTKRGDLNEDAKLESDGSLVARGCEQVVGPFEFLSEPYAERHGHPVARRCPLVKATPYTSERD
ncbi:MAG: hypothetical protein AAF411_30320, partial [Myxococcota bacterium]